MTENGQSKRKIKNQFKIANFSAKRVVVFQELLTIIENEDFSSKKLIELKKALIKLESGL